MEGIKLFKYHDKGIDDFYGKTHFHDFEFEILHILSGEGTMMIKDRLYPISPDTIFFVCGSDAHYSAPDEPQKYVRNKIIFSKERLEKIFGALGCEDIIDELFSAGGYATRLSSEESANADRYFFDMSAIYEKNDSISRLNFYMNILYLVKLATESRNKRFFSIKNEISKVMEYINANLDKKLTLDGVARNNNISKYYLCHSFPQICGMTVFEYIRFVRVRLAKRLLEEGEYSISQIAEETGFDSFAYFSKVFKDLEGITPSLYRKKYKKICTPKG